jgi:hypothetical protein
MTINNAFEYVNSREARRRFLSSLEVGRRNLTGKEFEEWAPSIENKVHAIERAGNAFLMQLAFGSAETVHAFKYVCYVSAATSLTPLQPTVSFNGSFAPSNLLTGASPESVAPPLFL